MLKGKVPVVKDENGNYFIDRNGSLFKYVVEYLYNSKFFVVTGDSSIKRRVKRELIFYNLVKKGLRMWTWDKLKTYSSYV
jgi:hypothetical protein